ncbi:luciferase domain-containing protein [Sphingomonas abietis]|uniref:DUF5519 family protein n=1 Tax=Sphingomonas abietis TaxID=3012344 RepID=A0ABY7NQI6_9SPHN|nr:luciferase family protein [Sphingomonas abietis]WBO23801.1 DUF5519 family protein [Sphingomonas abietis]
MPRTDKGPVAPPPVLAQPFQAVVDAVAGWPGVTATMHWHLYHPNDVDGVDLYVGEEELGHIHLDGAIHLATGPVLGRRLVAAALARPFRHVGGWVEADVSVIGAEAATALFRHNYEAIRPRE